MVDAVAAVHDVAMASEHHPIGYGSKVLGSHDFVGATFYIAGNMMLAFAAFFFFERQNVPKQWGTSMTIAGIVCLIAWYNYSFMKEVWVTTQQSPTVYRYTDWLVTVPLQVMEFYMILTACGANCGSLPQRLMAASIIMLGAGWLGETDILDKVSAFVVGMLGWLYIINEVHQGEAGQMAAKLARGGARQAFENIRAIVTIGWLIYPLGYALAYLIHGDGWAANSYKEQEIVNIVYNLADLVNKGAFGICIWMAAKSDAA